MILYSNFETRHDKYNKYNKAVIGDKLEIVKWYITHKCISYKLYIDTFHTACYYGHSDIVKYILDYSIKQNKILNILNIFEDDYYALFYKACALDDTTILKFLFTYMIKYNIPDYYKNMSKYKEIFISIFNISFRRKILNIIKCLIELYEKYNIKFDIIKCSYDIIKIFDCYDSDNEFVKYIIYLNTHNYNYTKYMYFQSKNVFLNGGYKINGNSMLYGQSVICALCNKKNMTKKRNVHIIRMFDM